jgi:hypothetical protein
MPPDDPPDEPPGSEPAPPDPPKNAGRRRARKPYTGPLTGWIPTPREWQHICFLREVGHRSWQDISVDMLAWGLDLTGETYRKFYIAVKQGHRPAPTEGDGQPKPEQFEDRTAERLVGLPEIRPHKIKAEPPLPESQARFFPAQEDGPVVVFEEGSPGLSTLATIQRNVARANAMDAVAQRLEALINAALGASSPDSETKKRAAEALIALLPGRQDGLAGAIGAYKQLLEAASKLDLDAWKLGEAKGLNGGQPATAIGASAGGGTVNQSLTIRMDGEAPRTRTLLAELSAEEQEQLLAAAAILEGAKPMDDLILPPKH